MNELDRIRDNAENVSRAKRLAEEASVTDAIRNVFALEHWKMIGVDPVEILEDINSINDAIVSYTVLGAAELRGKSFKFKVEYCHYFNRNQNIPHGFLSATGTFYQQEDLVIPIPGYDVEKCQAHNFASLEKLVNRLS